MRAAILVGSTFLVANLHAHQCGPTQIQLAPGEVFEYQITADLIEVLSDYTPLDTGNPNVAILSPAIPFLAHHGVFTIIATGFGETKFRIHWFYAETGASNICEVTVVVDATRRTSATGLLSFNIDRKRFVSDFDLAKMIDASVPQSTQRLLIFAQCYGGEFAASPYFNKPNTATASATRTGEQAQYSGYHDDAARALRPEPGRTGETVHLEGIAGIFQGAAFNTFPEHPTTGGGLPLASFSLEPVTATGAVRSRHIIIYAGKPDSQPRRDPETGDSLPDGQGGKRRTTDVQDRNNIRINFADEPNTTVWAVGGTPDADDPTLGTDGWDFSGTPEGLAAALERVRQAIANSPDPSKEQFALFVSDHGDFRVGGLTRVPLNPNSRSVVNPAFPAMDSARTIGATDPAFTFYVSFEGQALPIQRDAQGNYMPFFGASDFTMDVTPNGGQALLFDVYTEHYLELGDDILGNQPGEGLLFRFPVAPDVFSSMLVDTTLSVGITSKIPAAIIVNELAQETGPVARGPYDVAPEPNLTNTPSGPGPVAMRFEGLNLRIENVATPGLTIADREAARTGGLPPGVSMLIPYTSWSVESTAVFGAADVSLRTILPAGDMRATRLVVLKAEGDAPFQILPTTRQIENRPSIVLVTATTRVTGFSHFALGVLESAPPILNGVVSRKTHGAVGSFDLALGFVPSNPTTEPRTGGAGGSHTLVFTFDKAVTGGMAALTEGTASAGAVSYVGAEMIVPLAGAANAQYVTVMLTNVTSADGGGGGGGAVRIGFLAGDVNGSRNVTLTDMLMVNAALTQPVTAANFLRDVNLSGTLTISDKLFVNANLTQFLPGP